MIIHDFMFDVIMVIGVCSSSAISTSKIHQRYLPRVSPNQISAPSHCSILYLCIIKLWILI